MYGVHRATVVRWLAHARERVLTATRESLRERLGARSDDIESLMGLAASRFDLNQRRAAPRWARAGTDAARVTASAWACSIGASIL